MSHSSVRRSSRSSLCIHGSHLCLARTRERSTWTVISDTELKEEESTELRVREKDMGVVKGSWTVNQSLASSSSDSICLAGGPESLGQLIHIYLVGTDISPLQFIG